MNTCALTARKLPRRWLLGLAILATCGIAIGLLGYQHFLLNRSPIAIVSPMSQKVVTKPHSSRVTALYRITNAGGRDLVLGEASTTCGCSVASIQPKVLKSGEQGLIRVEGTAPNVGEKTVTISITTNAITQKPVEFQLTMVGSTKIPYVRQSSGSIRLGFIRPAQEPEKVWIETVENSGEKPWIRAASSPSPLLDVDGGLVKERPYSRGAVIRSYKYEARLSRMPALGEVCAEVIFRGAEADPILRLPVSGIVRPAAFASPAALFASCKPGDGPPKFSLLLLCDDTEFSLEAEVEGAVPDGIDVRRAPMSNGRVAFDIASRKLPEATITSTLAFKTNHPTAPRVKVPLTIRVPSH